VASRQRTVGIGSALIADELAGESMSYAGSITDYFNIPTNRVVELGTRVEI
jgi:hypothetical protein